MTQRMNAAALAAAQQFAQGLSEIPDLTLSTPAVRYEQDGADFWEYGTGKLLARIAEPFEKAGDWYSMAAALEAQRVFEAQHPTALWVDENGCKRPRA